jgi:hypothetical protein
MKIRNTNPQQRSRSSAVRADSPRQTTDQQDHDKEPIVEICFLTAMGSRWWPEAAKTVAYSHTLWRRINRRPGFSGK